MAQEETVSSEYQKRFNDGYLIAKHMPELAAQIKDATKELGGGFREGLEQFEKDAVTPYPSWLRKDRLSSLDNDKDLGRDMSLDEPEKE